ncbi:MAG: hypothetical protein M3419_11995 [Actinomycetota bacterium]|nr:hypothetical protein [Actinomycetota bacterium]
MTTDTERTQARAIPAAEHRTRMLVTSLVAITTSIGGAVLAGPTGLWGALAGGLIVLAFFSSSAFVLTRTQRLDPALTLLVAMALYLGKILALLVTLVALDALGLLGDPLHRTALALAVVACTLTWSTAEVVTTLRRRQPIYDATVQTP